MAKTYKLIRLQNIYVEFDDPLATEQVSQLKFRVFADEDARDQHATKFYGFAKDNKIQWNEDLEFKYTEQNRLNFQLFFEPQPEHQQKQSPVLYKGVYYLDKQTLSRRNSTHIYDLEGQKKGLLKWEISIVTKEQPQMQLDIIQKEAPLVREDLIGLIRLHEACLQINSSCIAKKHQQSLTLRIKFEGKEQEYEPMSAFKWKLYDLKLQYIIDGSKTIQFELLQKGNVLLEGKTDCQRIKEYRRFINHNVTITNSYGIKVGFLVLQYRYITKQQLLDLIYSPNNKLSYTPQRCQFSGVVPINKLIKMKPNESSSIFKLPHSKINTQSRYKVNPFHTDIKKSRVMCFRIPVAMDYNITQVDPQKNSELAVNKEKGPNVRKSSKSTFNQKSKGDSAKGSYKLPSIWSKY